MSETTLSEKPKVCCPNCDKRISAKAEFCPKCGQKQGITKVTMSSLLWKLWVTTIHLEGRFLRTLLRLFRPGQLTVDYFAGKQKRYTHPLQLYFLVLFFVFLIVSLFKKPNKNDFQLFQLFTTHPEYIKGQQDMLDSLMVYRDTAVALRYSSAEARTALDSLLSFRVQRDDEDSISVNFVDRPDGTTLQFSRRDVIHLPVDSLLTRYGVTRWADRLIARQVVRSGTQSGEFTRYWAGMLSWTFLSLAAVMAVWLKLLYWRQKKFYVEHFVLMLHLQTGVFAVFALSLILRKILFLPKIVGLLFVLWMLLSYYWGFKHYYQQSHGKTILKSLLFHLLHAVSLIFIFIASMGVAVLLF